MYIDHIRCAQEIGRIRNLCKALTEIGAPVPGELTEALEFSRLTYNSEAKATAATERLKAAKTPEEVDRALSDLSDAYSGFAHQESVQQAFTYQKHSRLIGAVEAHEDLLFGILADSFTDPARLFTAACADLPDLGTSEWDRTPIQSAAVQDVKRLKVELDKSWHPYKGLTEVLRYVESTTESVYALGRVPVDQAAMNAAVAIDSVKDVPELRELKPAMPYLALINEGIPLELHRTPSEIREQRELLIAKHGHGSTASALAGGQPTYGIV